MHTQHTKTEMIYPKSQTKHSFAQARSLGASSNGPTLTLSRPKKRGVFQAQEEYPGDAAYTCLRNQEAHSRLTSGGTAEKLSEIKRKRSWKATHKLD